MYIENIYSIVQFSIIQGINNHRHLMNTVLEAENGVNGDNFPKLELVSAEIFRLSYGSHVVWP